MLTFLRWLFGWTRGFVSQRGPRGYVESVDFFTNWPSNTNDVALEDIE